MFEPCGEESVEREVWRPPVPAGRPPQAEGGPGRRRAAASGPGGAYRRRRPVSRVTSSATGHGAGKRRGSPARAAAARPGTRT